MTKYRRRRTTDPERLSYRQCRSLFGGFVGGCLMAGMEADARASLRHLCQVLAGEQPDPPAVLPDKGIAVGVSGLFGALLEQAQHEDVLAAANWWLDHWDEALEALRQRVTEHAGALAEKLFGDTEVPQSQMDALVEKVKADVNSTRKH